MTTHEEYLDKAREMDVDDVARLLDECDRNWINAHNYETMLKVRDERIAALEAALADARGGLLSISKHSDESSTRVAALSVYERTAMEGGE